ncbi:hypothetical protein DWB77_00621 [Streptomyces hundungensis]|uniref:Uncharacterized protein n=1 Tax=Streptomyces hundungensis TaxID=1077946 RepID=A0A387H8M2_9ACTN|nr:hypothetical protein [Streptomyces hundungensis]AYG78513.1 hypothetical protein DWB77_00621 [Streptomyces hundungensis]
METELVGRLEEAATRFVTPLRMNEGFDERALLQLREEIDRCGSAWRGATHVPKRAALILAELSPAIEACAWLYEGDVRQRIQEAGVMLSEAVIAALD